MKVLDRGQYRESKVCLVCGRPFSMRKKWKKDWENVIYCSDRCRRAKNTLAKKLDSVC